MHRIVLVFFFLSLLINISFGQKVKEFEGYVEYEVTYQPKVESITVEYLEAETGKDVVTYFSRGKYKSVCESRFMNLQIFNNKKAKIYYTHLSDSDTLRWNSSIAAEPQSFDYKLVENADTILGEVCDKLVVDGKYGTVCYYFSKKYYLNADHYKNFTVSNKHEVLKIMESIYLKLTLDFPYYFISFEAKKVERQKLKSKVFKIPKHKILLEED